MRRITIEIDGRNEDKVMDMIKHVVQETARNIHGTALIECDGTASAAPGFIDIPSFMREGRRDRKGVAR